MTYLYFPGCKMTTYAPAYDRATRAVLNKLGVGLSNGELNCCGYPVRHESLEASYFSAARVVAIAHKEGAPLLTPCKCCYGNLKHARYWLKKSAPYRDRVNRLLKKEQLHWDADTEIRHLLTVLKEDVGLAAILEAVTLPQRSVRVAVHYGCHALRPAGIVQLDNPLAPTIFEDLVAVTGATAIDWPLRLDCCGAPLWEKNNALSLQLMQRKIEDAKTAGADIICTACTYCHYQFDQVRAEANPAAAKPETIPAILYPQLLGLALGIEADGLGLADSQIQWTASPNQQRAK